MVVVKAQAQDIFRAAYTSCGSDRVPYLIDVRPTKDFKKRHLAHSFNIQLSKNAKVLAVRFY